jgi:hypothetical protein
MSEKKEFTKCQNNVEASPKWLCLPMAIIFGIFGNKNFSATGFHPEISIKGNACCVIFS